jgi:hypothetical protein
MVKFVAGPHWAERSADLGADRNREEAEQKGFTCTCVSPRPLVKLIDIGPKPVSKIRSKVSVEGDICTKAAAVHDLLQPGRTRRPDTLDTLGGPPCLNVSHQTCVLDN